MDIEHLSKSQIVLLTLLVSFITSIATGIVTVSLMDQAPPAIAQTVNRVIERTVEKVSSSGQAAAVVTQQKTVVVKESDLVAQAVERATPSLVRIYSGASADSSFLGFAVVLDNAGMLAGDAYAIDAGDAFVELSDGAHVRAFVQSRDAGSGVVYFRTATTTVEYKPVRWNPIMLSLSHAVLGESVVALSGRTVARVADGIITALMPGKNGTPQIIDTDVASESVMPGSPLIDTDGSLIGISTGVSRTSSVSSFITAAALVSGGKEGDSH